MPEFKTEELVLNMGPQHPATHGVLRMEVKLDGEVVVDVTPHIGYLHRCFEKHCEVMTYPQVIPYTDRMDYLAAMYMNFGYVEAVEKLMNLEIPERVKYIRVIIGELQRIASHLVAIATFGMDIGAWTPFLYCFRDRERILDLFEMTCGARLLYNYMWVGGVSHDLHPNFIHKCKSFLVDLKKTIAELNDLLSYNKIFIERTANIGILPKDTAINFGATGPVLRGSGVQWDLRKKDPYSIYDRFDFEIVTGKGEHGTVGDCWDRYMVRVREMEQSIRIIEQAIAQIPDGDVTSAIPKRVKPPVGEIYFRVEGPKGELGYYIISDGSVNPFRVKVRAPSFVHLQLLPILCKGHLVADIIANLGSLDIVLGEIDR